jgi:hypothetical protein
MRMTAIAVMLLLLLLLLLLQILTYTEAVKTVDHDKAVGGFYMLIEQYADGCNCCHAAAAAADPDLHRGSEDDRP